MGASWRTRRQYMTMRAGGRPAFWQWPVRNRTSGRVVNIVLMWSVALARLHGCVTGRLGISRLPSDVPACERQLLVRTFFSRAFATFLKTRVTSLVAFSPEDLAHHQLLGSSS